MQKHALYVPRECSGATVDLVGEALRAVARLAPALRQIGVEVEVWRIRPTDLGCPRVLAAFERRGVRSLPALLPGSVGGAIIGHSAIEGYYRGLLAKCPAAAAADFHDAWRASLPRRDARHARAPPTRQSTLHTLGNGESPMALAEIGVGDRSRDRSPPRHDGVAAPADSVALDEVTGDDVLTEFYQDEVRHFRGNPVDIFRTDEEGA